MLIMPQRAKETEYINILLNSGDRDTDDDDEDDEDDLQSSSSSSSRSMCFHAIP